MNDVEFKAAQRGDLPSSRWNKFEIAFWMLPIAAYFLFPKYLTLGSQILIAGLFALSLDLILGYARIISLGHAAFFGVGAYTAGLLAKYGWGEPLSGLAAAAVVAAVVGWLTSFLVVRGQDLTRLMVTLGIGLMLYEVANQASSITGGVDGLVRRRDEQDLRRFRFRHERQDGLSLQSRGTVHRFLPRSYAGAFTVRIEPARHSRRRGTHARDRRVGERGSWSRSTPSAAGIAGIAGALLAQTTQFVGIDSLGFPRSAELMIMLVLGGTGYLYGALIGAAVFMILQDYLSNLSAVYWQFWLGLLLIVIVLFARGGLMGGLIALRARLQRGSR